MTSKNVEMPPKTVLTLKLISIFNILVSCSLMAIEAWISNNCGTRFSSAHGVLSGWTVWVWWTARGCFPMLNIKVLSKLSVGVSQLTGFWRGPTLIWPSPLTLAITHHFHINTPSRHPILRAWTWDPCIYFYKISTAWNSQNSCIVCWRFCLRLVIEEILSMEPVACI